MPAPTYDELANELATFTGQSFAGTEVDRAESVIGIVASMASAYTRGQGFTAGEPNGDVRAVVLSASARLLTNVAGVESESMGPFSVRYGTGFSWTVAERYVLDRYRVKAQ